ncbi:P-loop containing nucleoside triphosphate hydrolases superfamily protein [Rhynchospora pubera]|uniref:P-loop containing nucleoside triphosphate hydrolases superfamily protein n=1 Tax=Rhynchospora pubera TaxID=906938 RepID=A0AAV8FWZ8_9POAL|nr:P-loop containing nucleoside triphosphate hydrolases superfamily protein [Rhynchospora pubera]
MAEPWTAIGGAFLSFIVLLITMAINNNIPFPLMDLLMTFFRKVLSVVYPYDQITINEYRGEYMQRDELYTTAEAYLSSVCTSRARKLKAELGKGRDRPLVTIDDNEEVTDTFRGTKVWWYSRKRTTNPIVISFNPRNEERKYYCLTFHKRHRQLVEGEYLNHILQEGRAAIVQNRQRKLFTNNPSSNWYDYQGSVWSHVAFEHPATFDTLAMDPEKKAAIIEDLVTFREGKEYYQSIGKAWKRGIRTLLGIVNITPADVAEGLLRKKSRNNDVDACLKNLISEIEAKKEAGEDAAKENDKLKAGSSAQNALALEDDKADGIKE